MLPNKIICPFDAGLRTFDSTPETASIALSAENRLGETSQRKSPCSVVRVSLSDWRYSVERVLIS
jgi:hypothetical protein